MNERLRLLLVEDNPYDARLIAELLAETNSGSFEMACVPCLAAALARLSGEPIDLVLLDLGLPDSIGLDGLGALQQVAPDMPVVVLTGNDDERTAIEAVRAGAQDYLVKGQITGSLMSRVLHYAVERARTLAQVTHLNRILRVVRAVDQLIIREKERDRMAQCTCTVLVEMRGYSGAWIVLTDGLPDHLVAAHSGFDSEAFSELVSRFRRGEPAPCCSRAQAAASAILTEKVSVTCAGCPLSHACTRALVLTACLTYEGRVYGFLSVSFPPRFAAEEEERSLLQEIADEIAFALHNIEAEARIAHLASFPELDPSPIVECDLSGRVHHVNPAARRLFPDLSAAGPGHPWLADLWPVLESFRSGDQDSQVGEVKAEGRWYYRAMYYVAQSQLVRIYGLDITDRKQVEEALRESEAMYHDLASSQAAGIFRIRVGTASDWKPPTNLPYVYEFVNERYCELTGVSQEQYMADPAITLRQIHPDDYAGWAPQAKEADRTMRPLLWEGRMLVKGQVRWVHIEGRPRMLPDGTRVWSGVLLDITERKQAEEAFKAYSEHLEEMVAARTRALDEAQEQLVRREKLAVLGQLSGGIAHELRTPLGAIKNAAYFLTLAVDTAEPEVKEMLDVLTKEVSTSDRIINSLLDFAHTRQPAQHRVDVNQVVSDSFSDGAVPPRVQVERYLDEALPSILADPDQLQQALANIIVNAVQAMPDGGRLVIRTQFAEAEWIAISVTDTGVGIPPENLARIFEPLFTTKARGFGLGLALARMLVEAQGGRIEVESQIGQGSTFTIHLPWEHA